MHQSCVPRFARMLRVQQNIVTMRNEDILRFWPNADPKSQPIPHLCSLDQPGALRAGFALRDLDAIADRVLKCQLVFPAQPTLSNCEWIQHFRWKRRSTR